MALWAPPAAAASTALAPIDFTLDASAAASDNANAGSAGERHADVIGVLRPRLQAVRRGAGLELSLDATASFTESAAGEQSPSVRPQAQAALKATLVEQLLFFDAQVRLRQTEADPFGPRVDDGSAANRRTEKSVRASPWLRHELAPGLTWLLRREDALTLDSAGSDGALVAHGTDLRLERRPEPLGGALELSRLDSAVRGHELSRLTLESARFQALLAASPQWQLGADIGRDRSTTAFAVHTDPRAGAHVRWQPTPRTDIDLAFENRFYGRGGEFSVRHRLPWMSLGARLKREPVLASQALGTLGGGADVRAALDAILTTRYPDPVTRAGIVEGLIGERGTDTTPTDASAALATYPQLQTEATASWALLTARTTFAVELYVRTVQVLRRDGDPLAGLALFDADSRQEGGSLQLDHRLTPTLTLDLLLRLSRITGLGTAEADRSDDRLARLWLTRRLSPRTSAMLGLQLDRFTTTTAGLHDIATLLAFVGLSERF